MIEQACEAQRLHFDVSHTILAAMIQEFHFLLQSELTKRTVDSRLALAREKSQNREIVLLEMTHLIMINVELPS